MRRGQTEGAGLELALHVFLQEGKQIFVLIVLIGAYVDDEMTLIGDDIVLSTTVHNRHCHLGRTEQHTFLLEAIVAQPDEVVQSLIDGIHALVAGCMSAFAIGCAVYHHQSFLGNGRLHARRLTHDGHIYLGQFGQCHPEAAFSADLFLAGSQVHQVILRG